MPAADIRTNDAAPAASRAGRTRSVHASARALALLLVPVGFVAVAAAVLFWRSSVSGDDGARVALPDWALPSDAVKLRDDDTCAGTPARGRTCRTMALGVTGDVDATMRDLRVLYRSRGWSAGIEFHDLSLHVAAPGLETCAVLYPNEHDARAGAEFDGVIEVTIDDCLRYE